jgi:hypothetical protein
MERQSSLATTRANNTRTLSRRTSKPLNKGESDKPPLIFLQTIKSKEEGPKVVSARKRTEWMKTNFRMQAS